ncbi:MAG: hypothetical protein EA350_06130 [Gemmatimonadales bacterium]|nr:MAG: hypothetical protein EA350_06130 [Gemmatimonadales bacterium]
MVAAAAAIGGGGVVIAGALLPWLTLFAGLYSYPGITGPNGWFILAGGVLAVLAGACLIWKPRPIVGHVAGGVGLLLLGISLWLVVQQQALLADLLEHHPMAVAEWGPGLLVVAVGAFLVALAPLFQLARRQ